MSSADLSLLALHGLRLTGLAEVDRLADVTGVIPERLEVELRSLAHHELVARRDRPPRTGWLLTDAGRGRGAALVAAELEASGARRAMERHYARFCQLNPRLLDLCSRWQVIDMAAGVINRHHDPAYDRARIDELARLDDEAQPLTTDLAATLPRFRCYGGRLSRARHKVQDGALDWFTGPLLPSFHTVWFELHEDLLSTLGLERASETARLSRSSIEDQPEPPPPSTTRTPPKHI